VAASASVFLLKDANILILDFERVIINTYLGEIFRNIIDRNFLHCKSLSMLNLM
jgi:hypothetical protein